MFKQATATAMLPAYAFAGCSCLVIGLSLPGCSDRTNETAIETNPTIQAQPAALRSISIPPRQFLADVFARYRGAAVYHDEGVVRLSYRAGDRVETKVAPMRMWLDHGRCYVVAYDVRLCSDDRGLFAWIRDDSTNDFDSQVLSLPPLPGRLNAASLFRDPILVERISAGLAGPPPQVEWLFSEQPMKHLFHPDHQFAFASADDADGHPCHRIQVDTREDRYRFWVDQQTGVVRRIDLPPIMAPPNPGEPPQRMTLSVNLRNADFHSLDVRPDVDALPSDPQYVKRFIPLPPIRPAETLGKRPPSFQISSPDNVIRVTELGSDREATIIIRCASDAGSSVSAERLQQWSQTMPPTLRRRIRVVGMVDGNLGTRVAERPSVPLAHDRAGNAADSLGLAPGALAILDRSGRLVWRQSDLSPAGLVTLGAIVADVLDGVDVPRRIRDQWDEQTAAYRRAIRDVTSAAN